MLRKRFDYPDLDDLDSPLVSPTPLASGIPGSALAERIFNDPESWEDNEDDDYDFPEDVSHDQLNWLAEELEKFKQTTTPAAQPTSEKAVSLISTPIEAVHQRHSGLKGIGKRGSVRPISLTALFDHSKGDFSSETQQQLSKILDSGGIPHHIRPHSPSLTPPSTSGTASSIDSPLQIQTASAVRINNGENSPSPINVYSASATLSFLEWYGIYPDSPRLDFAGLRPKSLRMKAPLLQVPSPRQPMRPSPLISSSATATFRFPPAQRISPVDPPGLEPPSKEAAEVQVVAHPVLLRPPPPVTVPEPPTPPTAPATNDSPDHLSAQEQPTTFGRPESNSSERGRALRTAPPTYTKSPLPQPFVARSISDVTNHSTSSSRRPQPRVNGGSEDLMPIRRLPSIPPESARPRSATPPQSRRGAVEPGSSRRATPPPLPPLPSASSNTSAGLVPPQQIGPRPLSARSPLGGPAGPRVRSRGREATGFAGIPSAKRLPGLRV